MMRSGFYIVLSVVLFACEAKQVRFQNTEEFKSYISNPENGFITKEKTNDLLFEARLIPPVGESDENAQCTVQLRVSCADGSPVLDYGNVSKAEALEREGYLSFDLLPDVYLEVNDKTVPAVFHHYERNYGLKPSIDVFFNFNISMPEKDVKFFYRDQLFGQGLVQLNFSKDLFNTCYVEKT